jgi:ABC-2 type transport system permease protein
MSALSTFKNIYFMELRKLITYRADFWINFLGQTVFSILIAFYLWTSIFESQGVDTINGFTLNKIFFYYLIVPIVFRLQQGETIGAISGDIYEGRLNKFLLYPLSFYLYKIATYLAHSSFFIFQLFALTIIYSVFFDTKNEVNFTFINLFLFVIVLIVSSITYFFLNSITELLAFWADNIWSLGVVTRFMTSFFGGAIIPISFFPQWALSILDYTPFPYMINFPMKVFFGEYTLSTYFQSLTILMMWMGLFAVVSNSIWTKGKYQYTGVGI